MWPFCKIDDRLSWKTDCWLAGAELVSPWPLLRLDYRWANLAKDASITPQDISEYLGTYLVQQISLALFVCRRRACSKPSRLTTTTVAPGGRPWSASSSPARPYWRLGGLVAEGMSERQIRKALLAARQLAEQRQERFDWEHLCQVMKTSATFSK